MERKEDRPKHPDDLDSEIEETADADLSEEELREVEQHALLPAPFIYQTVRQEGSRELQRPAAALWWSGVAAGISIGLSGFAEAILHMHLPDTDWRPLVENFGYCVGFLVVILARHQLFTETTLTAILPLMIHRNMHSLRLVIRMWSLVAASNMAGGLAFALFWTYSGVVDVETLEAMRDIARHTMENDALGMFVKAIAAGVLMASLVWIMPSAKGAEFWAIVLITYLIAVGELTHVVAGGVEVLLLVVVGEISFVDSALRFGIPAFAGNVIGGTGLFGLIVYAQVRHELLGDHKLGRDTPHGTPPSSKR